MAEEQVKTGVDDLLEILRGTNKIALSEVAKKLEVPSSTVQAWVDFLVEEGILGIEYKFTTPFIYINKPIASANMEELKNKDIGFFKTQFIERAKKNNIPEQKVDDFWKNHLLQELALKKKYFFFEAENRKLLKIDELWAEYQKKLLVV